MIYLVLRAIFAVPIGIGLFCLVMWGMGHFMCHVLHLASIGSGPTKMTFSRDDDGG